MSISDDGLHKGCSECGGNQQSFKAQIVLLGVSLAALIVSAVFSYTGFIEIYGLEFLHWLDPAWISVIICGAPIFLSAFHAVAHRKLNSSQLIALAIAASVILEFVALSGIKITDGHNHSEGYIFVAGEIAFLMALGELIEDISLVRAGRNLKPSRLTTDSAQNLTGALSAWLIPLTLAAAIFTSLFSGFFLSETIAGAAARGITVLVAFCPCAIVLSEPTAIGAAAVSIKKDGVRVCSRDAFLLTNSCSAFVCTDAAYAKELSKNGKTVYKSFADANNSEKSGSTIGEVCVDNKNAVIKYSVAGEEKTCGEEQFVLSKTDGVKTVLRMSKRAVVTIKLSLVLSLIINTVCVVLGFAGVISPAIGAALHNVSIVVVVACSSFLLFKRNRQTLT